MEHKNYSLSVCPPLAGLAKEGSRSRAKEREAGGRKAARSAGDRVRRAYHVTVVTTRPLLFGRLVASTWPT